MKGLDKGTSCEMCSCSCIADMFTGDDLQLLDENKTDITYNAGEIILKQGSYVSQILFLKEGIAKIILEGKNDRNTILKIVEKGNFIGLAVLGEQNKYPFTVVSLTKISVCQIRRECLLEIINRNDRANQYIVDWFSTDHLFLYSRLSVLSTRHNHGKLASSLVYLNSTVNDNSIFSHITRKDLAELSSISVESTNRILLELKNDKIIEYDQGFIRILKPELLKRLSEVG